MNDNSIKNRLLNTDFLDSFEEIISQEYTNPQNKKTKLTLFVHNINSNEFDYKTLTKRLLDPVINFSLSKKTQEKLKNKPATLSSEARAKFIQEMNTGELGELLLFCFLETHLSAPKILSKLELKTSNSFYVNGSDGIHFLKNENGNYQLIFGESKTYKVLTEAINQAISSISDFKNEVNSKGNEKSGIQYEKSLISSYIEKEMFNKDEVEFIEKLIYPRSSSDFYVDDAFGIFIGYEIKINEKDKELDANIFREKIYGEITDQIKKQYENINQKISNACLQGHSIYIYILPFTNLEETRKQITKAITK